MFDIRKLTHNTDLDLIGMHITIVMQVGIITTTTI